MRMDQLWFAKSISYWGQAVAKSLSGPPFSFLFFVLGRKKSKHLVFLVLFEFLNTWKPRNLKDLVFFFVFFLRPQH